MDAERTFEALDSPLDLEEFRRLRDEFSNEGERAPNLFCEIAPLDADPSPRAGEKYICHVINPIGTEPDKKVVGLWGAPQEVEKLKQLAGRGVVLLGNWFSFDPALAFGCDWWASWVCFIFSELREERGFFQFTEIRTRLSLNPFTASKFAIEQAARRVLGRPLDNLPGSGKPNPNGDDTDPAAMAGIVWQSLLIMPPLSAAEIAAKLGQPLKNVERILRYLRGKYPACYAEDDNARIGEARFRHKMPDVIPHLKNWMTKRQKKGATHQTPSD